MHRHACNIIGHKVHGKMHAKARCSENGVMIEPCSENGAWVIDRCLLWWMGIRMFIELLVFLQPSAWTATT